MNPYLIVPPSPAWPADFQRSAANLRATLGPAALRIDHIGSTSIPNLPSKDIIDIQITVADLHDPALPEALAAAGFQFRPAITQDHVPPGYPDTPADWRKRYFREPPGHRELHIHIRRQGSANQRYALLFRDYLRAHPEAAAAYGQLKQRLAPKLERDDYVDAKDPVCDLIVQAAEVWARAGWTPGPSDA